MYTHRLLESTIPIKNPFFNDEKVSKLSSPIKEKSKKHPKFGNALCFNGHWHYPNSPIPDISNWETFINVAPGLTTQKDNR